LNVWTFPLDVILKSVPTVPIANVWETPVIPLIDATLLLKVFQSNDERAPVVVELARPRESPDPEIIRPLVAHERKLTLLLKIFQSTPVIAPVVDEFAILIPNTPFVLLYVSGPFAERDRREILVARTHESVSMVVQRVLTVPERLNTVPERERKFVERVSTLPERLKREPERLRIRPERERISPVAVEREFERARRFPVAVAR
jgi:hypothetical protein